MKSSAESPKHKRNTSSPAKQSTNQSFEEIGNKIKEKLRRRSRKMSIQYTSSLPSLRNSERIIKTHNTEIHKTSLLLHNNLKSQESSLELKILARKEIKTPKDFSKSMTFDNDENKDSNSLAFEKDLEIVIEKNVTEKYKKVQDIKLMYKEQIQEIKQMKSTVITKQLVKEMKKSMELEIQEVKEQMDHLRQIAIRELKQVNR